MIPELQARVGSVKLWFPDEDWPDLSDSALLATLDAWLAPYLSKVTRREHLGHIDLLAALRGILNWQQQRSKRGQVRFFLTQRPREPLSYYAHY